MSPLQPRAEFIAIRDGRILQVGLNKAPNSFCEDVKRIDCNGNTIIPGFNDAHIHILGYASKLLSIDCSPTFVESIEDIKKKIQQQTKKISQGNWIKASGYNEFYLAERRHPTRRDLDQIAPNHPVKLSHRSLHACVLNSMALSLAGITIETPDPSGGMIDRELDSGEPSGLLFGMNAYISEQVIPSLSKEELKRGIELVNKELLSNGITSVQDASVRNGFDQWQMFLDLKEQGIFIPRVSMMFGAHAINDIDKHGLYPRYGDEGIKVGSIKIVIDEVSGRLNPSQEELNEIVLEAHNAGFQVAIHAVEEGTIEAATITLEYCLSKSPRSNHRHRIEHCSVCPPSLMERLTKMGVVIVTQPAFVFYNGERYMSEVSESQLPWLYRVKSFKKNGLKLAGSSDCPVVSCNPLVGIYAAVTRKAENGTVISPEETISVQEALEMFTLDGSYASFEEDIKGSIEVGKLADMVILSDDPTRIDPDEIKEIQVEKTIIGGEVVWEH